MKSRLLLILLVCAMFFGCSTLSIERENTTDMITKTTGVTIPV